MKALKNLADFLQINEKVEQHVKKIQSGKAKSHFVEYEIVKKVLEEVALMKIQRDDYPTERAVRFLANYIYLAQNL